MARLLAIEWDNDEARLLMATSRGNSLTLERAVSVPIPSSEGKTVDADAAGAAIKSALQQNGFGKADCVVAVGRTSIELKYLTLPPAPDDELPELVRFQAQREFNSLGEDWPLDYLPLDSDPTQQRSVLAAAVSPQLVTQVKESCAAAGIEAKRMVLRPCATASLLRRHRPVNGEEVRLLVDVLSSEVDLTVLRGEAVVFLRTARAVADGHTADSSRPLILEIRRTLAAISQRLGGQKVDGIYVCGDGETQRNLAKQIQQELDIPAHVFDPYETVQLSRDFQSALPQHTGRFAPLIGMLSDEAEGGVHAIDFLHPRQKPPPPKRGNRLAVIGALAAAVVGLGVFWIWNQVRILDDQIATLKSDLNEMEPLLKRGKEVQARVAMIDKWAEADVNWLEELDRLATKLPEAKDVMLTSVNLSSSVGAVSTISLLGVAKTSETIAESDRSLQSERHRVAPGNVTSDSKNTDYPWSFASTVVIVPEPPAPANAAGAKGRPAKGAFAAGKAVETGSGDSAPATATAPATTSTTDDAPAAKLPAGEATATAPSGEATATVQAESTPAGEATTAAAPSGESTQATPTTADPGVEE